MNQRLTLKLHPRQANARAVRRGGLVPAVLYGHGMAAQAVAVEPRAFQHILQAAGTTALVNLVVGETTTYPGLIRAIQYHPLTDEVLHADFYRVRLDEAIRARVPLQFVGTSPAVTDLQGVLVKNLDTVELQALPEHMPHDIAVDISALRTFNDAVHVRDLTVASTVKLLTEVEAVVAVVHPPRSDQELEELTQAVQEDVEAVEGVKKEEPAPEEAAGSEAKAKPTESTEKAEGKP